MPRKKRPLDRDSGRVRDASLLVIASEDQFALKNYFQRFRTRRVQFVVLPTDDSRSSPKHVVDRLDSFKRDFDLGDGDQLWFCGDRDHWTESSHAQTFHEVLNHCQREGYRVALSNPCFELWLLLHFADFIAPIGDFRCSDIVLQLRTLAGGYNKRNGLVQEVTEEMVLGAVRRAKALDTNDERIPGHPMTRVYLILEELIKREAIKFAPR